MKLARTRVALIVLAVGVGIAGCADLTAPSHSISGTWALASWNGSPPPMPIFEAGSDLSQIVDMTFTFDRRGTYTSTGVVRSVSRGFSITITTNDHGIWTVSGDSVALRSFAGGIAYMHAKPERLSLVDPPTRITMSFARDLKSGKF